MNELCENCGWSESAHGLTTVEGASLDDRVCDSYRPKAEPPDEIRLAKFDPEHYPEDAKAEQLEEAARAFIRQRNLKRYGVESEHAHWTIAEVAEFARQQRRDAIAEFVRRVLVYEDRQYVDVDYLHIVAKEMSDE